MQTHEGQWMVTRWGGLDRWPSRVVFLGSEDLARKRYAKEAEKMRQGKVELVNGQGATEDLQWAPRLRSRW